MAGLCESGNEPPGSLKAKCDTFTLDFKFNIGMMKFSVFLLVRKLPHSSKDAALKLAMEISIQLSLEKFMAAITFATFSQYSVYLVQFILPFLHYRGIGWVAGREETAY
ncbi:hypothetical protein ANN_04452 [Periplaneta americana]|uniref:Uncharacterized protein n=1 Tax=Periplaneta americana TaxID=6978 RepID=A0ABQ8T8L5_PERAM|nr:hypothetical protein ANN_04452 [Periplaneta americana]